MPKIQQNSADTKSVFSLDYATTLVESQDEFPVDFDNAWKWVGFSTKGNAKRKLENSPLQAGVDYLSDRINNGDRGKPKEIIRLSTDAFKHFAMMANTERGHQVRQYMIEAEKALRSLVLSRPQVPKTLPEALRLAADEAEKRMEAEKQLTKKTKQLEAAQPAIEYVQRSVGTEGTFSFEQAAKMLHMKTKNGRHIGRNLLVRGLEEIGVLSRKGKHPVPLQKHINAGRFEVKHTIFKAQDGTELSTPSTRITSKGVYWIRQQLIASGCRPSDLNRELPFSFEK